MNKALILGASSLLLILTILLLLPNKTYDHSTIQHTTFKQTGGIINTHSGHSTKSWGSTNSARGSSSQVSQTSYLSSGQSLRNGSTHSGSYSSIGSGMGSSSYTNSDSGIRSGKTSDQNYSLLSRQHQSTSSHSNYSTLSGQSSLQLQSNSLENKVYANRTVGVNTTYQMANQTLIAQTNNSESTYKPFVDVPVTQKAMMNGFPDTPGEIAPLGHAAALLIFGLSFLLIKIVIKKRW